MYRAGAGGGKPRRSNWLGRVLGQVRPEVDLQHVLPGLDPFVPRGALHGAASRRHGGESLSLLFQLAAL